MTQWFARLSLFIYALVCLAAFAWWAPNFFSANPNFKPQWDLYYIAGSGVPYGLLVLSIVALQSILKNFSFLLALEFILSSLLVWCVNQSFYYPPQAAFFCPVLVWFCLALVLVNLFMYQREHRKLKITGKA